MDVNTDIDGDGEAGLPSCEMGYCLRCFAVLRPGQLMHPDPDREPYIQTVYFVMRYLSLFLLQSTSNSPELALAQIGRQVVFTAISRGCLLLIL